MLLEKKEEILALGQTAPQTTASELIFEWGKRGEARRAESWDGVLGEGAASHSPSARGFVGVL